ncbi:tRNA (adenosine(37)-N6)-threonylcarbamoyltransferase complex transferase subunit TsaD [Desulfurobacterium indicum]|uniref:tRNA N6-adenosine threonylcarbamoyltransferase n=1 Tax=Desulfurobacterium indicum TaxID=1914305 RepID=A0A1R1MMZ4_9BACT|nr:tRNA (adenosine(37)-N6)-threonylcarbamoyltransferase complex transferase subunit TsaD [Desulfurobacterium indicum]OMH41185.1 tRNA (adenosine(37)-N6)-threonylcarbamoyltransferase complex transferase subunit TsaD [Desulfurobacterium indicum]
MKVLGIDTSCDDTAVAIYDSNEKKVLSNVVSSQYEAHRAYGGVVPEIAAREHLKNIDVIFREALEKANVDVSDIDLVAVTYTPGLLPALLVGLTFGKGVAFAGYIPFKGVHHIEAHMFSPFIKREPEFPFISLVVSGGHTMISVVRSLGNYKLLGKTLDDAIGEAFDKVAKMLDFGYPGGPAIDRIFRNYKENYLVLPKPQARGVNMSFSGLKTAVRRLIEDGYPKEMIAASFQKTAIDYVVGKLRKAVRETGIRRISVSGGVSANSYLRERLQELEDTERVKVFLPEIEFTSDNGAMVAYVGYLRFEKAERIGDPFTLNAYPSLPITGV